MSPLILITGIFGAGKTTFLRQLLPLLRAEGWTPNVILNHHDRAAEDAANLGPDATRVVPITGGCLCCDQLDAFLDAVSATPVSEKSVLIVEASAAANSNDLLEALVLDPRAAKFSPPVQVTIVDAMRWQRRDELNHLEGMQVITAPYLVINRLDELKNARRQKVESSIASLNPYAHLATVEALPRIVADVAGSDPAEQHFSTLKLLLGSKITRPDLSDFLNSLPREVIRAKGIAQFDDTPDHPVLFEKIDGVKKIYFQDLKEGAETTPVLIAIGPNLPAESLKNSAASHHLT